MSAACHFAMLTSSTYHHCILHEPGVRSRHSHTGQSRRCWGELLQRTEGSRSNPCHCRKEMTPTIKALSSHSNAVATTHPENITQYTQESKCCIFQPHWMNVLNQQLYLYGKCLVVKSPNRLSLLHQVTWGLLFQSTHSCAHFNVAPSA